MEVNDSHMLNVVFITKPAGDQLTYGSKSLSFHWFLLFKVNILAYIIIFHDPLNFFSMIGAF